MAGARRVVCDSLVQVGLEFVLPPVLAFEWVSRARDLSLSLFNSMEVRRIVFSDTGFEET